MAVKPEQEPLFNAEAIRERIGRAEAALEHTNVFKADGLVADAKTLLRLVDLLDAVAVDALALLDQHISDEQRQELGVRIIDRMVEAGRLQ